MNLKDKILQVEVRGHLCLRIAILKPIDEKGYVLVVDNEIVSFLENFEKLKEAIVKLIDDEIEMSVLETIQKTNNTKTDKDKDKDKDNTDARSRSE